ncbi:Metallo-dependent hydrolase [Agrocybe pediades]|nr:Metallo-dependent hydrolase [Agrocybe pediades]
MLYRGTFVHAPSLGVVQILEDHLIEVNEEGNITYIGSAQIQQSIDLLAKRASENISPIEIPKGSFLLPAFCDLHLHAPQFLYQGTGLDLPLMKWLDTYALKAEARMDADPELARRVYTRLAQRLKENGTGTTLLFGTIKEETNLILAECMQTAGCRAFVGKLSMDIDITPPESTTTTYVEPSAEASLDAAKSFIHRCHGLVSHLPPSARLVEPVLTPRFVPTCTNELLDGLGKLLQTDNVKLQSHLAEAKDQVEWVRAERGMEDIDVFDKNGLLTSKTIQAHCTFLTMPDLDRISAKGTAIAHCPLSNAYFSAKPFPLREALDSNVKVGLGTDVAGGYSLDIMNAMRQAVAVSRMREGDRLMQGRDHQNLSIDWKESLYLATRGGALALGLQGMFCVGAPFDAQEIRIYDAQSWQGLGTLDYFDLDADGSLKNLTPEMIEKWWCIGDHRNRMRVWIQGKDVWSA